MLQDYENIAEAYTTQVPEIPINTRPSFTRPVTNQAAISQDNQEVKKESSSIKDWIRLPKIDNQFKARMAAVLIVELINTMSANTELRDLVLKEIKISNRLHKRI